MTDAGTPDFLKYVDGGLEDVLDPRARRTGEAGGARQQHLSDVLRAARHRRRRRGRHGARPTRRCRSPARARARAEGLDLRQREAGRDHRRRRRDEALRRRRAGGRAQASATTACGSPSAARRTCRAASAAPPRSRDRARAGGARGQPTADPAPVAGARRRARRRAQARAGRRAGKGRACRFTCRSPTRGRLALVVRRARRAGAEVARARRRRRPADAHALRGATPGAAGPTPLLDLARRRGTRRASISSRAAATSPGPIRASWSRRRPRRRRAAKPQVRSHLHLDGRHAARRQGARLQPEDARADAELRRLRRRRHALRVGAGAGHLVAAVARVAADRRLPERAQGGRARGAPVEGRALHRRGDEEGRLRDRRCSRRTATCRRSGASIAAGTPIATSSARTCPTAPTTCGRSPSRGCSRQGAQARVRLLRHRRAARHLQPAQAVPGQVLEQALQRADQAGEDRRAARRSIKAGKLKINDNDRAYLEALHDGEITESDAFFATFIADLKKAGSTTRRRWSSSPTTATSSGSTAASATAHSVYQELVHVPLIIRAPGHLAQGQGRQGRRRDDGPLRDDARSRRHQARSRRCRGRRWCRWPSTRSAARPRAAFTIDGQVARGLKVARYRLVQNASQKPELYDELDDRREQKNLAADHPIALRQMRNVFSVLLRLRAEVEQGPLGHRRQRRRPSSPPRACPATRAPTRRPAGPK